MGQPRQRGSCQLYHIDDDDNENDDDDDDEDMQDKKYDDDDYDEDTEDKKYGDVLNMLDLTHSLCTLQYI